MKRYRYTCLSIFIVQTNNKNASPRGIYIVTLFDYHIDILLPR